MKARGGKGAGRQSPAPEVRWVSEPSDASVVRAQLRLLGKSGAEVERAMRDESRRVAERRAGKRRAA